MIKITFQFPQSASFRYVAYFFADEGVCCDQLVCVPFGPVIHNRHVPEIRRDVTNVAFFYLKASLIFFQSKIVTCGD